MKRAKISWAWRAWLAWAVFLGMASVTSAGAVPTEGLVGYWPMEGNANDYSGNGHHGVASGSASFVSPTPFKRGQMLDLGADFTARVEVPHDAAFGQAPHTLHPDYLPHMGAGMSMSFAAWVKRPPIYGFAPIVFKDRSFEISMNTSSVCLRHWRVDVNYVTRVPGSGDWGLGRRCASVPIQYNQWFHLTVVFYWTTAYIYINGALAFVDGAPLWWMDPTFESPLVFGTSELETPGATWQIDEVVLYDRPLGIEDIVAGVQRPAEIAAIMNDRGIVDSDGNGACDRETDELDLDEDGVVNDCDACPAVAAVLDLDDHDGCPDPDRDGDGVSDLMDAFPDDPTETEDEDNDGVGDNADFCQGWNVYGDLDGDGDCNDRDPDDDDDGTQDFYDWYPWLPEYHYPHRGWYPDCVAGSLLTTPSLPIGLEAHWSADNNTLDSSPKELHATAVGDVSYVAGPRGKAFHFGDGHVAIQDTPALRLSTSWTITAWFRKPAVPSYQTIINKEGEFELITYGSQVCLYLGLQYGWAGNCATFQPNQWNHVAVVSTGDGIMWGGGYFSSSVTVYVNGALGTGVGTYPLLTYRDVDTNRNELRIGDRQDPTYAAPFNGDIDEVTIHSRPICANYFAGIYASLNAAVDTDGDGYLDDEDAFPDDPTEHGDGDDDGVGDNSDPCHGVNATGDTDGDDACNDTDPDDDNDGVLDVDDAFPVDPEEWADGDDDDIGDNRDNCAINPNPNQADNEGDGLGDVCDPDDDNDGVLDVSDNCPTLPNGDQADTDQDTLGNACEDDDDNDGALDLQDNCPFDPNADQADGDVDGQGDACDGDDDGDTVLDGADNCPLHANTDQLDTDAALGGTDGLGDACDLDDDDDGIQDDLDTCRTLPNPLQENNDSDALGDACDDDDDEDGLLDLIDNCPLVQNADQRASDDDTEGDACDADDDNDGLLDAVDNCPTVANDGADLDGDGMGDACDEDRDGDGHVNDADVCPDAANPEQADLDGDGLGDLCDDDADGDGVEDVLDNCQRLSNPSQADHESDGVGDPCDDDDDDDGVADGDDNCPLHANAAQTNCDDDPMGDACDPDDDNDEVADDVDNCPALANPDQLDLDFDTIGDACDEDIDGDGVVDLVDNCAVVANPNQADLDADGTGDACDGDIDGDGIGNDDDNCPTSANPDQVDLEGDGMGDVCDPDDDGDGVLDPGDNCPQVANPGQVDTDLDGSGDACDDDDDGDGVPDGLDRCPTVADPDQTDTDQDGQGDACDADDDGDGLLDVDDSCPKDHDDGADLDADGLADACDSDDDDDGIPDNLDLCDATAPGQVVLGDGCSLTELCPCAGPFGQDIPWENHGQYEVCVVRTTRAFVQAGKMTEQQRSALISAAGQSDCGKDPCHKKKLLPKANDADGVGLALRVEDFAAVGSQAPATLKVYAGSTLLSADANGEYIIPLRSAQGQVIKDALSPSALGCGTSIPRGAVVALRQGDGSVVLGTYGRMKKGNKVSMKLFARFVGTGVLHGGEKNLSFERPQDGTHVALNPSQDEYIVRISELELRTTVSTEEDLMRTRICQ